MREISLIKSPEILVDHMKRRRKELGMNQTDLSKACGFTLQVIAVVESRKRRVSINEIRQICNVLDLNFDKLIQQIESTENVKFIEGGIVEKTQESSQESIIDKMRTKYIQKRYEASLPLWNEEFNKGEGMEYIEQYLKEQHDKLIADLNKVSIAKQVIDIPKQEVTSVIPECVSQNANEDEDIEESELEDIRPLRLIGRASINENDSDNIAIMKQAALIYNESGSAKIHYANSVADSANFVMTFRACLEDKWLLDAIRKIFSLKSEPRLVNNSGTRYQLRIRIPKKADRIIRVMDRTGQLDKKKTDEYWEERNTFLKHNEPSQYNKEGM